MITGRQIAAARALLGMSQGELARASNISIPSIKRLEGSTGPVSALPNNLAAIRAALEQAGVAFIAENGGGPGVRLKYNRQDLKEIDRLEEEGGVVGDGD